MRSILYFFSLFLLCFSTSCSEERKKDSIRLYVPLPPLVFPIENPIKTERIELGRLLFFDPILSVDSTISCSSCHFPEYAFSDTLEVSKGAHGRLGFRNSPSLFNLAWKPHYFKDGGVRNLELQVLAPLLAPNEMDFGSEALLKRLNESEIYRNLFLETYGSLPSLQLAVQALASYERSLVYNQSRFDLFLRAEIQLTEQEMAGMRLFYSPELACSHCHSGVLLTDFKFHDIGLPESEDVGRYRVSLDSLDKNKFETPSLKAVSLTAPYMHNGSFQDLKAVIEWYSTEVKWQTFKEKELSPLNLSASEKEALLAFLLCL